MPDSLDLITPYVLQEQGDWFEDEVKFVRDLMQPGERAIDVGANYGVYALSMAKKTGVGGHVWAFEPASTTVSFLTRSIEINNFRNMTVAQYALSDRAGYAQLGLNQNSELNSLCHETGDTPNSENVPLTTLDQFVNENGCKRIDFVKLDAEGEESNIINGGMTFFSEESPLIMYELNNGRQINTALIQKFDEIGYRPYRLIPGLNILAPFDAGVPPDQFQLNLFCCKDDRGRLLEERGVLANHPTKVKIPEDADDLLWRYFRETKFFARNLLEHWRRQVAVQPESNWNEFKKALVLYSFAHDLNHDPNIRYSSLKLSYKLLASLCQESSDLGRLCTFARVCIELGYRAKALETINRAITMFIKSQSISLKEPFLPVSQRFDDVDSANRFGEWFTASLLEPLETLRSFSSYYTGESSLHNLDILLNTGFARPEMDRRRQLIRMRFGHQAHRVLG